jgi:hypothetical protein
MEPADFASIIAHLKGAPISTLLILLSVRHPVGERTLSLYTGYCMRSVKEGLQNLLLLGLVDYIEKDGEWRANTLALKLLKNMSRTANNSGAVNSAAVKTGIGEKMFFTQTGSCSSLISSNIIIDEKRLQQPPPKPPPVRKKRRIKPRTNLPDDAEIQQAYLLLVRTGIPSHKAEEAILSTITGGWDGEQILNAVNGWLEYTSSARGDTIKQPGFYIVSRLENLQEPPDDPVDREDELDPDRYTSGKYGHLIKH